MYTFDKVISRNNTECVKYDRLPYQNVPEENYPLWIADMDFETAPEIMQAIRERMNHEIFGYFMMGDRYFNSIVDWHKRRFGVNDLEAKHICYQNGVLAGVSHILDMLTKDGDPIILQTPGYPGFTSVLRNMGREIVANPMINDNGYYTIDYKNFEDSIVAKNIKVFIFCNPHNPTGRVWTAQEMQKLVGICLKHGVTIIADEIWADMIINKDMKHLPLMVADPRAKEITIAMYSPSKGYNLAGMVSSYSICYNEELGERLRKHSNRLHCNSPCVLAIDTTIAAYDKAEGWLDACVDYISGNMDYIVNFLETRLPKIKCRKPDGTYVMWLDFTETGITHEEMLVRAVEKAGFICNDGHAFTQGGDCHMRLNPTTARANIEKAMAALEREFSDIAK